MVGATGYVGQRLLVLLANHPFFQVEKLAAGERSAGKTYAQAMDGRWKIDQAMPGQYAEMPVYSSSQLDEITAGIDLAFCAVDMEKEAIIELEEAIAKKEVVVVSNNSAHRWTPDVPMVIPEINSSHLEISEKQKQRLGTKRGFIVTKPNCSVQSFLPALVPLLDLGISRVMVSTYQAVSGAGRLLSEWPEMHANVIPYIGGEEEKTEKEPLKILGRVGKEEIINADGPQISGQCIRVPVQEGHLASVWVEFEQEVTSEEILDRWQNFKPLAEELELPLAPKKLLHYFPDQDRPQPKLDSNLEQGMAISLGRLREDAIFDYKFICLSANTLRGAAGGSVLTAELLYQLGYLSHEKD